MVDFGSRSVSKTIHQGYPTFTFILAVGSISNLLGAKPLKVHIPNHFRHLISWQKSGMPLAGLVYIFTSVTSYFYIIDVVWCMTTKKAAKTTFFARMCTPGETYGFVCRMVQIYIPESITRRSERVHRVAQKNS